MYETETRLRREDLRAILATKAGQRWVWWLTGRCHVFSSSYTGNNHVNFLEGERNIGILLHREIMEIDPELMGAMSRAHQERLDKMEDARKEK